MTSSQDSKNCRDIKAIYSELLSWKREEEHGAGLPSSSILAHAIQGFPILATLILRARYFLAGGEVGTDLGIAGYLAASLASMH